MSPSDISCDLSESRIELGETVGITCVISPSSAVSSENPAMMYVEYSKDGGTTWILLDQKLTDYSGGYFFWEPESIGSYLVKTYWNGNSEYQGAESIERSLEVVKIDSTISCFVDPSVINLGESTEIDGYLHPAVANAKITISYRPIQGNWSEILTVSTSIYGHYSYYWTPTATGTYEVKASWSGDENHHETENSNTVTVNEPTSVESSSISCLATPSSILIGSSTTISGYLSPSIADAEVTISYRTSGEDWNTIQIVSTTSSGYYSFDWTPANVGTYEVKVSWSGDETYQGSENSVTITVANESQIVCKISSTEIVEGEAIGVTGSLIPSFSEVPITLTFTKPDGSKLTRHLMTDIDGKFNATYTVDEIGNWAVSASWIGNEEYEEINSSPVSFNVKKGQSSLIDFLTRPDVIGIILAVASSIFGVVAWVTSRIRKREFRMLLDEVIKIRQQFKNDSTRCEAELLKVRNKALEKLKLGRITNSEFDTVKERVDEFLDEIKTLAANSS